MAERKLTDGERINAVQNAFIEKLNQVLDFIPGYRGYRKGVENVVNMAQGNPSNYSATDYARDLGYSMVPFYSAYDNAINGQPQDWKGNALEAALFFTPIRGRHYGKPVRGPRQEVRVNERGVPNMEDLKAWELDKSTRFSDAYYKAVDEMTPDKKVEWIDQQLQYQRQQMDQKAGYIDYVSKQVGYPDVKDRIIEKTRKEMEEINARMIELDGQRTEAVLNTMDEHRLPFVEQLQELGGIESSPNLYKDPAKQQLQRLREDERVNQYIDSYLARKLNQEYGEEAARRYYNELRADQPWKQLDFDKIPK